MFLSHPPIASRPSSDCPRTTVSMLSAMTSRETREHFMPSVPIEMPSLIVIVPNVWGMPPARRRATSAAAGRSPNPALQGVIVEWPLATPTIGLAKSASVKPTARSMARFGARWSPWVTAALRRWGAGRSGIGFLPDISASYPWPRRLGTPWPAAPRRPGSAPRPRP